VPGRRVTQAHKHTNRRGCEREILCLCVSVVEKKREREKEGETGQLKAK
jgi:hypothetical protein